jgi:3-oxoacyl-[acyl-carrier protein] reductase
VRRAHLYVSARRCTFVVHGTAEGSAETCSRFPEVDILVNNLGIYEAVGFFDEPDEAWQRLFEANISSGVRLAPHYLNGMLARKTGPVVFISSESAISPSPERSCGAPRTGCT